MVFPGGGRPPKIRIPDYEYKFNTFESNPLPHRSVITEEDCREHFPLTTSTSNRQQSHPREKIHESQFQILNSHRPTQQEVEQHIHQNFVPILPKPTYFYTPHPPPLYINDHHSPTQKSENSSNNEKDSPLNSPNENKVYRPRPNRPGPNYRPPKNIFDEAGPSGL